ncbi:O-antigen ligase family protein [Pedobacter frigoris]|uniref:O-antigen ligase family protein n=1 Tax=Pedobacter frigoris TaxID=2571272 RepID=UPI00292DED80|nr:O-antigen ligase family protein [Pedobacter frigoris]
MKGDAIKFSVNKGLLFACSMMLTLPIDILQVADGQSGFPLSLIVVVFAPFCFIKRVGQDAIYIYLTIVCSLISIVGISFIYQKFELRPYLSFIYFTLPTLGYFVAMTLVKDIDGFNFYLKWSVNFAVILAFSLIYTIFIKGGGIVRLEGNLQGSFFGLNLSGAYGVHTLGAHYFILMFLIFYYITSDNKINILMRVIYVLSLLLYILIILLSLSRELLLGLFIFFLWYSLYRFKLFKTLAIVFFIILLTYFFGREIIDGLLLVWETKLSATSGASNLNDLSSGRLDLQELAVRQIVKNPIFATGFNGYILDYTSYKDYDNLDGWSTHIYYLTCIWKMGVLAFVFYAVFWWNTLRKILNSHIPIEHYNHKLLLIFVICLLFINLFWDAFLAPNIMAWFSFFCGGLIKSRNGKLVNFNNQE